MAHIARTIAPCRNYLFVALVCVATTAIATSCTKKREPVSSSSTARWTCPMHPKVVSEIPSTCPRCRMDLVPVASDPQDDHWSDAGILDAAF
jgi:hypothetical protein